MGTQGDVAATRQKKQDRWPLFSLSLFLSFSLACFLSRALPLPHRYQTGASGFPTGAYFSKRRTGAGEKKEPSCGDPKKAEPFFAHPSLSSTSTKKTKKLFNNSPASGPNRARILAEIREENDWKTDFVLGKRAGAALR